MKSTQNYLHMTESDAWSIYICYKIFIFNGFSNVNIFSSKSYQSIYTSHKDLLYVTHPLFLVNYFLNKQH